MKYPIIVFSFQYKRFSKSDFLTATGDQSRRKVKDSSSLRVGKFFGSISHAPWEMCSATRFFFLSGLLVLHQIIKLDPTNQSQSSWTWRVGSALSCLPGSVLKLLKISSLLALTDNSLVILDVPHLENA